MLFPTVGCGDEAENIGTPTAIASVSPEIALIAKQMANAYLSDKTWGFFGATCDQWLAMDYEWQQDASERLDDGRVSVVFGRLEERILGPEILTFRVDIDSGEVKGENKTESGRMGVAEGCDTW